MSETWKQWKGRTVDGKFPLQEYLGGSDHSAVFLTVRQSAGRTPEKAAIKLIPGDRDDTQVQLRRWESARVLMHPNLLRIFEAGRCEIDNTSVLYVIEEYAEENLSQVLPERALTAEEVRGMLPAILRALQFLHDKGFVHGRIRPSNILAVGDQVKLSSDTISPSADKRPAGKASAYDPPEATTSENSTASDSWLLGITLIEVLTQRSPVWDPTRTAAPEVPAEVPEPFRGIAASCLHPDPAKRSTIADIERRVGITPAQTRADIAAGKSGSAEPDPSVRKASKAWSFLIATAAVVAVAFVVIPRPKPSHKAGSESAQAQPSSVEMSVPHPSPAADMAKPSPSSGGDPRIARSEGGSTETATDRNASGVIHRVLPEVSPTARRTIHGKIAVRVRVKADTAGNVEEAKLESNHGSKYFNRLALDAARNWKFSPAGSDSDAREWKLQFFFTRGSTDASATPAHY